MSFTNSNITKIQKKARFNFEESAERISKGQKFHMYVIDSRTIHKNHVCGVDTQGNWQLADKISANRYPELEPMEMTSRQVHLAIKQLKDCISGKYRTIEVVPA